LSSLPLCNIADCAGDQDSLFGFQRTQTDFDWKLRAVLALSVQLQAGSHWTDARFFEKAIAVGGMPVSKSFGRQQFDLLPKEFFALISKQLFYLGIDQNHPPVAVDNHHRIRRSFQESAELLLCPLPLRDVQHDADEFF